MVEGAVAAPVSSASAILAGSTFATDVLYLMFISVCDRLLLSSPRADIGLIVDDLSIWLPEAAGNVTTELVNSTRC